MSCMLFDFTMQDINWVHILDILLACFLLYRLYKLIERSTALNIGIGFFVIYLFYGTVKALKLKFLSTILGKFIDIGPIIAVILFQREIRHFLFIITKELMPNKDLVARLMPWLSKKKNEVDVTPIVKAVQSLGGSNTGALIVFTKDTDLRYYEASGDLIHAIVSSRLLIAIFNKYSPLHDGAVIIHNNKIVAARCILPVSDNPTIPAHLGLRHKAAIGLTEITDTLVVVVSEESGQISIARKGAMENNLSVQEIRSSIKDYLK